MSREYKKLRMANYFVWVTLFIWVILWVIWFYPRNTVEVKIYKTERLQYNVGDELIVYTQSQTYFNGQSNYDVRLICDGGRYLLKSFEVTTTISEHRPAKTSVGIIPVIPTPDNCVVRTQATHEIQIMPFIKRTYTNAWETNRFLVEAER